MDYIQSTFPIGAKRSRSAVIRQRFAERTVLHLNGNKDPAASFRHLVKKNSFALLDMPSAGIRDVLVASMEEEQQVLMKHSTLLASVSTT